ncbi:serine hydrolase [Bacillus lacus]|uniref:Serine hydrolase n=1 Tax=Metabacillus lacus TaxID=1983721 RepID=A0A7X2J1X4_9BACI|nr:serine hydrolase domain-containing protein [Metabacillus lacus]MRX73826.1 serine hydrolase [Metabacillus lacus]
MKKSSDFSSLNQYVVQKQKEIGATAAAVYILKKGIAVNEYYAGNQGKTPGSRTTDEKTLFPLASIRKTYLGLAISLLIEEGKIKSLNDSIEDYLDITAPRVTLRHLVTHTHGLDQQDKQLLSAFAPGTQWMYNNSGVDLLIELIQKLTDQTLHDYVAKNIFTVYQLTETHWKTEAKEYMAEWPRKISGNSSVNFYASARDLAKWGCIHLNHGRFMGKQLLPRSVFERVVMSQTPSDLPKHFPRNGYFWWLQHPTPLNQLGEALPEDAYLILGISGCACLVIPSLQAVAVRMYNQTENPSGYNYLEDIRQFGNLVAYHL